MKKPRLKRGFFIERDSRLVAIFQAGLQAIPKARLATARLPQTFPCFAIAGIQPQHLLESQATGHTRLFMGYAGWGPGQLESEIESGVWFTIPAESALIFDREPDKTWEKALAKRKVKA